MIYFRFPKMTNETIKDTLSSHFAQLGAAKADKKWIFVNAT
jgi:chromatin assembly factor 1 subunit A